MFVQIVEMPVGGIAPEEVELVSFSALKERPELSGSGASDQELVGADELDTGDDEASTTQTHSSSTSKSVSGIDDEGSGGTKLVKELSLLHMIGFVVGEIIGSGIFVSPYIVLSRAGSAGLALIVWAVGGIIAICGSLCYAELGTLLKKSGGEYTIFRETYSFRELKKRWLEFFGSLMAFLFAWASSFLVRPAAIGIITLTFGSYLSRPFYIGCDIPPYIVQLFALAAISKSHLQLQIDRFCAD